MHIRSLSLRLLIMALLWVMGTKCAQASTGSMVSEQEQILRERLDSLSAADNPTDSIAIIFDVFDLLPPSMRPHMGHTLYELVLNNAGVETALDVLRLLAIIYSDNSRALNAILAEAQKIPESDEQKETLVFISIYLAKNQAQSESLSVRKEKIADMVSPAGPAMSSEDFYENLLKMLTVCIYTREVTEGSMLNDYLHYMDRMLENHPLHTHGIRRQYAEMKAEVFTTNDDPVGAFEADKELLRVVDEMESEYLAQARKHLALHWFRYRAYERILRNYRGVPTAEIEKYYKAINELADSIPEVRAAYNEHHYPDIYYLMKKRRYAEVFPMIRHELQSETGMRQRRFLLRQMVGAAEGIGDKSAHLRALKEYIPLLQLYVETKAEESSREMEIIYKIGRMRKDAIEEEIVARRDSGRRHNTLIICVTVAILLMLAAIAVLTVLSVRLVRTERNLKSINRKLLNRRDELTHGSEELLRAIRAARLAESQKSAFIKYISSTISLPLNSIMEYSGRVIASSDRQKRQFLNRFASVVQENSQILKDMAAKLAVWGKGDDNFTPPNHHSPNPSSSPDDLKHEK